MPAEEKLVCVGRESNPGQLLGRQLCLPLYHQRSCLQPSSCSSSSQTPHPPPSSPLHVHFLRLLQLLSHSAFPTGIVQIPPYWEATAPKKHNTSMTWSKQGSAFPSLSTMGAICSQDFSRTFTPQWPFLTESQNQWGCKASLEISTSKHPITATSLE